MKAAVPAYETLPLPIPVLQGILLVLVVKYGIVLWAVPAAGSLGTSISLKYVIPPQLPPTFLELLGSSSIEVLRLMKNVVSKAISDAEGNNNPPPDNISDYVEHIEDLGIDDTLAAGITKELGALN